MSLLSRLSTVILAGMVTLGLNSGTRAAGDVMIVGSITSQPIGHYEFCVEFPDECSHAAVSSEPVSMTRRIWRLATRINRTVNRDVLPMNDYDIYGRDEVWTYPSGAGDCEDFVLEKQRQLAATGIPLSDLLITVVRKPDGEGHAVLTLRTDSGDYILDNLRDAVLPWNETDYAYLKRQSSDYSGHWVSLRTDDTLTVGSVD